MNSTGLTLQLPLLLKCFSRNQGTWVKFWTCAIVPQKKQMDSSSTSVETVVRKKKTTLLTSFVNFGNIQPTTVCVKNGNCTSSITSNRKFGSMFFWTTFKTVALVLKCAVDQRANCSLFIDRATIQAVYHPVVRDRYLYIPKNNSHYLKSSF
jgi:hypothetical protein